MLHPTIPARWSEPVIVAATGPSLTEAVASHCERLKRECGWRVIAVNDAYRVLPFADALYACDIKWWDWHKDCEGFPGEKWSCHGYPPEPGKEWHNDKRGCAERHGLNLVHGKTAAGFSTDPAHVHYGQSSGFQAVNLAGLWTGWRQPIFMIGFDMRVAGKRHFFGDHPKGFTVSDNYQPFIDAFNEAARRLPKHVSIVNCTPGSALTCFPMGSLDDVASLAA